MHACRDISDTQEKSLHQILPLFVNFVTESAVFRTPTTAHTSRQQQQNQKPMVTNPIYDGQQIYETIADATQNRPVTLQSNSSFPPATPTSTHPLLRTPSSPNSEHPLLGYPPTPVSIDPTYAYPTQPQSFTFPPCVDDGYTMMASVEGVGKPIAEPVESKLDMEGARYVTKPSKKNEENV